MKTLRCSFVFLLVLCLPTILSAQILFKGRITNAQTGEPLAGASVQSLSDKKGTVTNEKGLFEISLPTIKSQIRVSHIGFSSELVIANPKAENVVAEIPLMPTVINTDAVVVTATRTRKRVSEVPGRTEWLSTKQLEAIPVTQADDYLRTIPGVQVSREHGILDHSSTVSMRGLGGDQQGRYLVLLDGVPLNKADGGSVNWNSLNSEEMSRIEIAKGPGSSLYGGNAMGGVMNFVRKKPVTPFEGSAQIEYGDMNTMRGKLIAGGRPAVKDKSFFWSVQGFGGKSDGYVQVPEEERDSTVIAGNMREWGGGLRLGYQINQNHSLELNTGYWWDRRGSGTRIFAETGTYFQHGVMDNSLHYKGSAGKTNWSVTAFNANEDYARLNESIKASGSSYVYTSYSVTSKRKDQGILVHADHQLGRNHLSLGADFKIGSVFGQDIYTTSTDTVTNKGKMRNYALYFQDQITLVKEHLFLVAGIRYDLADFYDGGFYIASPTSVTSILGKLQNLSLESNKWSEFSPKLALQYTSGTWLSGYFSFGHGFRPPVLDDMCRSGFIRGGFKRANPYLGPEALNNFEAGFDVKLSKIIKFSVSSYYSGGKGFVYLVGTGDSILQGSKMRPLSEATNISGVQIFGVESALRAELGSGFSGYLQYAFTDSEISEYEPTIGSADLTGKRLIYVPEHQISGGLIWRSRWINASLQGTWLSQQWMDDLNSVSIPAHLKVDARIWTDIAGLRFFINGQNLTNSVYLEGHGLLSLGRFISGGVTFNF